MCEFPAKELIRMRRQVSASADKSNDPAFVHKCCEFVRGTDELRLAHEDLTGCGCWYAALKEILDKAIPRGIRL